jgi:hypothetical protein
MDVAAFIIDGGAANTALMPDGAPIAEVHFYHELLAALRQRAADLQLSNETVEATAGLASRYLSKVIGPRPCRSLANGMFDGILGALSCKLVLVHDKAAFDKLSHRYVQRQGFQARLSKTVVFTSKVFQKMGKKGAAARTANLSPKRRSEIARLGGLARWAKLSAEERHAEARRLRAGRAKHRAKTAK